MFKRYTLHLEVLFGKEFALRRSDISPGVHGAEVLRSDTVGDHLVVAVVDSGLAVVAYRLISPVFRTPLDLFAIAIKVEFAEHAAHFVGLQVRVYSVEHVHVLGILEGLSRLRHPLSLC